MMMSFKDAQNYKVLWSDFTMVSRFRKNIGKRVINKYIKK